MLNRPSLLAAAILVWNLAPAQAALQGRDLDHNVANGYEAYYDTTLDITWLTNANAAGTTLSWSDANQWASALDVGGVTGWRLPSVVDADEPGCDIGIGGTDCGVNVLTRSGGITYSELGHLYYNTLGNVADVAGMNADGSDYAYNDVYGMLNSGPFQNVQTDGTYWTNLPLAGLESRYAWNFYLGKGEQGIGTQGQKFHAWAVHDGSVGAVPEASTLALALAGLGVVWQLVICRRPAQSLA